MKKQPLFDVSRFNRIADKHNIPWIDRIPLIETICWGSKAWIDPELAQTARPMERIPAQRGIRRVHA